MKGYSACQIVFESVSQGIRRCHARVVHCARRAVYEGVLDVSQSLPFSRDGKNAEVAAAITMQPVNAYDVDAAIVFQDLLPILEAMGLELDYVKGAGPVITTPFARGQTSMR